MKICFVLQAGFTYMGHAMACQLKELLPGAQFCAFAQLREGLRYLQTQKDIAYGHIPLEEDMHNALNQEKIDWDYLRAFEHSYGIPNLWPYLYIDRIIMFGQYRREYPYSKPYVSYEDMLKRLQATAKTLTEFLDREKPEVIVFSVIGSTGSLLLYHMAKKRGIKTLIFKATRVGQGMTLTEEYLTLDRTAARFKERLEKNLPPHPDAERFIADFRSKPKPYSEKSLPTYNNQTARSAHVRFLLPHNLVRSIRWHGKTLIKDLAGTHDYTHVPVILKMWDKLRRKIRGLRGYDSFYSTLDYNVRFAFYPLHLEPETALLLDAPYHTNQLELIRAAARSLPIDMLLFVKEHPEMVGYRTRDFYREICKIPNVRLIHPRTLGYDLLQKASLVFTITGTAGFEAAFYKTPVITFTGVYYDVLSNVVRCKSFEELPFQVQTQLAASQITEQEILHFISALIEESVNADYGNLWNRGIQGERESLKKDEGVRRLASLIAQRIAPAR